MDKLVPIRYWMLGREYHLTLQAMEYAPRSTGTRKDGVTPEFEHQVSIEVKDAVVLLTKKHRGTHIDRQAYYDGISKNRIASIVKGADRMDNIQTMLKISRRKFTSQEPAYELIKATHEVKNNLSEDGS